MSKCWYCNNELTTGDNPKHFGICNKCYDEMFKSSDTIIRSFINKISDLEAKLAESEEKCKKAYQEGLLQKQFDKDMEIEQLKQQLHDLPKKIVKEIINNADLQAFDYGERYCEEEASNDWAIDLEDLKEILDTILKKYGEEK